MRLTKEEFCTAVSNYEQMCREESRIVDALGVELEWTPSGWIEEFYDFLIEMCDFSEEDFTLEYGTDLDYFCYNLDFGKKWRSGMIIKDGKDIPCRNAEELWNMIMESRECGE